MNSFGKLSAASVLLVGAALAPNVADAGSWGGHGNHGPHISFGWSYAPHIYSQAHFAHPAPWTPTWFVYCRNKYRSFDPQSGTFIGYDGHRHFCR